jgi:hypothetical protein
MSEVWPLDVVNRLRKAGVDRSRPFKCLLLMPFEGRFDRIAGEINACLQEFQRNIPPTFGEYLPKIDRLDWVTSSGVVQNEIWEKIASADLIFCDITGYNPNVMFESGVAAALKRMPQVVFIRDHFFNQQSPFDIAPIRYTEYELTSDGLPRFHAKVMKLIVDAFTAFPDDLIETVPTSFPATIDFQGNHDDLRIYTPPFAHRRVVDGALEFGSLYVFSESWASMGNERIMHFDLEFEAAFRNPVDDRAWIGVGFRSQHFYANYSHLLRLNPNGFINIAQPNEIPPDFYTDKPLRGATPIDRTGFHHFHIRFTHDMLLLEVDDFSTTLDVANLPKVFGPGLIRFQSSLSWAAIKEIRASAI